VKKIHQATKLVHADKKINRPQFGGVHEATNNSVLFDFDDVADLEAVFQGKKAGHVYSRSSSSSAVSLQNILAELDGGMASTVFATGMAAISATMFSLLKAGDHIIVSQYLFGNTRSFFDNLAQFSIDISYVDVTKATNVEAAIRANTKLVFCETIANPCTQIADLYNVGSICEQHQLLFVVDNTMSPCVMFDGKSVKAGLLTTSLTKYVAGHGNVLGGAVIDLGLFDWSNYENIDDFYKTADPSMWGTVQIRKKGLRDIGATLAPQSAHLVSVGLETLSMRMQKTGENALCIANYLLENEHVSQVNYPGLSSHPQHLLANQLFGGKCGFGGILSFEIKPSIDMRSFLNNLELILIATHLGDTRTLALPVATTIFYENGPEKRAQMGISDTLIRVSVGIEDAIDLVADIKQALLST
jgi:O-acetylhomoserine (thiol)-lyase